MEMQETDNAKLMINLNMSDFTDPPKMPECLVSSRENDCVLFEIDDISTYHRESCDINRDEEGRDNVNDMEKRKSEDSLPITVLDVPENQFCSLGNGKEKVLCVTSDACIIKDNN